MPWYGFKRKRLNVESRVSACDYCHRTFAWGDQQVKSCYFGDGHWLCLRCYDSVPHTELEPVSQ